MNVPRVAIISGVVLNLLLLTAIVAADDDWRRTAQGWECASGWESPVAAVLEVSPEPMHPLHLAAIQVVASTLALAFFTPSRRFP